MIEEKIDDVLTKISLAFGADSVELLFPNNMLVDLSLYNISKINTFDIESELVFQSKVYMLFVAVLAHVTDKYVRSDASLEQLESCLFLKYEKLRLEANEGISDKKIEKCVKADIEYIIASNDMLDKKNLVTVFDKICKGLECRRDMVQMIASKRNKEIGSNL